MCFDKRFKKKRKEKKRKRKKENNFKTQAKGKDFQLC